MTEDKKQDEGLKLLKDIRHIEHMIEELQCEIDRTYSMLTSTTVKTKEIDVMTSTPHDPMGERMATILEYQEELQNYQKMLCEKKSIAISILRDMCYDQQVLLILKYLKGRTIEEIAEELGRKSYYHTWEVLHKAEEEFCNIYMSRV